MKNRRKLILVAAAWIPLLFCYLFSHSYFLRYTCIFFLSFTGLAILYVIVIPRLIRARNLEPVLRGIKLQEIDISLEVRNISPIPIPYFTITEATGQLIATEQSFVVSLRPFEVKTLKLVCRGQKRGEFFLGPVTLEGSDPAGIFSWKRRIDARTRVIVYPSIRGITLVNDRGLPSGSIKTNNKIYEDVTRFRSLREYVPGDDIKRINWKASAKTGKLHVMEFDAAFYFPVRIVLNFCFDDYPIRYRELLMEKAIETAASLTCYFADLNQELGFAGSGYTSSEVERGTVSVQPRLGYENARKILEILAMLRAAKGSADFDSLLHRGDNPISIGTRLIVISPRLSENQASALIAAQKRGVNIQVKWISSPSEERVEEHTTGALPVLSMREAVYD